MRYFLTAVLILLSNGTSTVSFSKHIFCSFSSDFFPFPFDLSLYLSLLGLESFSSFHFVSDFLIALYSLTACWECCSPFVKLSLHYENIDNVYIWHRMHEKMKDKKNNMERSPKNGRSISPSSLPPSLPPPVVFPKRRHCFFWDC